MTVTPTHCTAFDELYPVERVVTRESKIKINQIDPGLVVIGLPRAIPPKHCWLLLTSVVGCFALLHLINHRPTVVVSLKEVGMCLAELLYSELLAGGECVCDKAGVDRAAEPHQNTAHEQRSLVCDNLPLAGSHSIHP